MSKRVKVLSYRRTATDPDEVLTHRGGMFISREAETKERKANTSKHPPISCRM